MLFVITCTGNSRANDFSWTRTSSIWRC